MEEEEIKKIVRKQISLKNNWGICENRRKGRKVFDVKDKAKTGVKYERNGAQDIF